MNLALGIVVLAALAGEPADKEKAERIAFTVRTVEVSAVEWRQANSASLHALGRQGASQIWTIAHDLCSVTFLNAKVVNNQEQAAKQGQQATFRSGTKRAFVTGLNTIESQNLRSFRPHTDTVFDGNHISLTAEETPWGLTTTLSLDSSWVSGVSDVHINTGHGDLDGTTVQMPQVVATQVKGAWTLAPNDVLIVSLGQQASPDGTGVIRERLAVIETRKANPTTTDAAFTQAAYHPTSFKEDPGSGRQVAILANKPMPKLPSRSLLAPIGPDGKDVELPPLPVADNQLTAASFTGPFVPRGTPQSAFVPLDTNVSQASFATATLDGKMLSSGQPQTFRVSLGSLLDLEINAKVVPKSAPE